MFSKELTVNCIKGEDVKWATHLVQTANNYASTIRISHKGYDMNAKSLLGVLSLGIAQGMTIKLIAEGSDENEALEGLQELIDTGFQGQ